MYKTYNPNELLFSLHIPKSGGTSFRNALIAWFTKNNKQFIDIEKRPNIQMKARWFLERGILQTLYGDYLFLHYKNHIKSDISNLIYKEKWLNAFSNQSKCIHGHFSEAIDGKNLFDFYPSAKQFIAFIRNPLELHLSMFYYHSKLSKSGGVLFRGKKIKTNILDVDEWLEHHGSNMLHFFPFDFTFSNFKEVINSNFIHIGITEEITKSLDILAEKLSKPKVEIPVLNQAERFQQPSASAIKVFEEKHRLEFEIYNYVKSYNRS